MAYEANLTLFTFPANADLSASQYHFVTVNNTGKVALTGANAASNGVLQNKPGSGQAATVATAGISKVVAGAAITQGAYVMSDSTGRAIAWTSGNEILGQALQAASGAGIVIAVQLQMKGTA